MSKEKVLLVIVAYKGQQQWPLEENRQEMVQLAEACGGEVIDQMVCRLARPSAPTLIGEGKLQQLAGVCGVQNPDTVIFSEDLKGSQQRNLEEVLKIKTIDRTQMILDIFARHATSQEGKMQVELAQLQYLLPRLVGQGIALSRLGGGIGTLGPGETKLEVDRRRIGQRIAKLKRELTDVAANRAIKRKRRQDQAVPLISLVGYTNAGKSTLLNALTDAQQQTRDGLFTTLDSLARQWILPNRQKVILSDTVGFMHALPHHLIEAFKATLEEVQQADLLLHVLDASYANFRYRHEAVLEVLQELESGDKPVITVLNKVDRLGAREWQAELRSLCRNPVWVSARTGENMDQLKEQVVAALKDLIVKVEVFLPIQRMDLINLAHEQGQVFSVKYYNDAIHVRASLPRKAAGLILKAQVERPRE